MVQDDAGLVDEFDLDIRLWNGGSFGSLSEQFPTMGAPRQLMQTNVTCTFVYTCNALCRLA